MIDKIYHWNGYNKNLAIKIHQLTEDPIFYQTMKIFSAYVGNFLMAPITILVIAILVYLTFKIKKGNENVQYCVNSLKCFATMLISFVIMAFIVKLAKSYFAMPRPYCSIEPEFLRFLPVHKTAKCFRSFPSGHSSYITILIFSLWPIYNNLFKLLGAAVIFMVALSRIAMAMHYPVDVITSIIISLIVVFLIRKLVNAFDKKYESKAFDVCKCLTS